MNTGINFNNSHEDSSLGPVGYSIFLTLPAFLLSVYGTGIAIYLLITEKISLTEDYIMIVCGFFFMLGLTSWFLSNLIYAWQTIQKIWLDNQKITIRLYFCRKVSFNLSDLKEMYEFKITKLMSQIATFPVGGTGIIIEFKRGKRYRISPNMDEFVTLKEKLTQIIKDTNHN